MSNTDKLSRSWSDSGINQCYHHLPLSLLASKFGIQISLLKNKFILDIISQQGNKSFMINGKYANS